MNEEIESHKVNGTWELTNLPSNRKAITEKWVFKVKSFGTKDEHFKARLILSDKLTGDGIVTISQKMKCPDNATKTETSPISSNMVNEKYNKAMGILGEKW